MGKIYLLIGMEMVQYMPNEIKQNVGTVLLRSELNSRERLVVPSRIED